MDKDGWMRGLLTNPIHHQGAFLPRRCAFCDTHLQLAQHLMRSWQLQNVHYTSATLTMVAVPIAMPTPATQATISGETNFAKWP